MGYGLEDKYLIWRIRNAHIFSTIVPLVSTCLFYSNSYFQVEILAHCWPDLKFNDHGQVFLRTRLDQCRHLLKVVEIGCHRWWSYMTAKHRIRVTLSLRPCRIASKVFERCFEWLRCNYLTYQKWHHSVLDQMWPMWQPSDAAVSYRNLHVDDLCQLPCLHWLFTGRQKSWATAS